MDIPRKRRRGEIKVNLIDVLDSAISSQGNAELAMLDLFNRYDFDIGNLVLLLQEKRLNVSFSNVSYHDIAPRVGLESTLAGYDMPTFEIHRARIPTSLFKSIVGDLEIVMNQYGEPRDHKNVEARSRFLAPLFNRTIALFRSTIRNAQESMIPGRMTTRGRVEHHFSVFGRLSILVIEVKYTLGNAEERLNAIAQVIAECDACDYANDRLGFPAFPVYGILCDGSTFEFFSFDGRSTPPTVSRGVFCPPCSKPLDTLVLANYHGTSDAKFIFSLRPICETLFYFFLLAYKSGIEAYMERSVSKGIGERHTKENMPGWKEARGLACRALTLAMDAARKAAARDHAANQMAENALQHLQQSLAPLPTTFRRDINLLRSWDEKGVEFF